jgi:hypothetical protein
MAKAKHNSKLKGSSDKLASAAGTAAGVGTATAVGVAIKSAAGTAAGTGTATGAGNALKPAKGTAGATRKKSAKGSQTRRVLQTLVKLYPDGKVPDDVPTETVRGQVAGKLAADNRKEPLTAPSWDTVNRALGRG